MGWIKSVINKYIYKMEDQNNVGTGNTPENDQKIGEQGEKTLHNTTASHAAENVGDIKFWGNGDTFKLISKASSKGEKWMKSTKAMQIPKVGCVVQVTTQQGDFIAEAVTFVPAVKILEHKNAEGLVISRTLVSL